MQCSVLINKYKNQLIDLEADLLSIKSLPFPSLEKIQSLSQAIQQISSDEENLTQLIHFNDQQKSCLSSLNFHIKKLADQITIYQDQIKEKNLLIDSKSKQKISLKFKIEQIVNQDQELLPIIFQSTEEVSNLTQIIEPKRIKLEALKYQSDELKSKHFSLSNTLSSLKKKESQLRLEVEAQESNMERLVNETERLISEKHHLQSRKNDLKLRESLSIPTSIQTKPKAANTDNCPVCLYPKVGRVKICKICNTPVHQKCMSFSECFNCNQPNK